MRTTQRVTKPDGARAEACREEIAGRVPSDLDEMVRLRYGGPPSRTRFGEVVGPDRDPGGSCSRKVPRVGGIDVRSAIGCLHDRETHT